MYSDKVPSQVAPGMKVHGTVLDFGETIFTSFLLLNNGEIARSNSNFSQYAQCFHVLIIYKINSQVK